MPRKIPNPDYFEDKQPFKMTPIVSKAIFFTIKPLVLQCFNKC